MSPALRIPEQKLREYQQRYVYTADPKLDHIRIAADSQKFLTVKQLHDVALWKSKRRADLTKKNPEDFVREITTFAFAAKHEESRIGTLVLLHGVQYPTASVILHFCVDNTYPILDFRAIWSLGMEQPTVYSTSYWLKYIEVCRSLSQKHGMSVRELDMALWQFSKEHQKDA